MISSFSQSPLPPFYAVIVAGGQGLRMHLPIRKQYLELAGVPLLIHTLKRVDSHPSLGKIVLVIPHDDLSYCREEVLLPHGLHHRIHLVSGGNSRQNSVMNGLKAVKDLLAEHAWPEAISSPPDHENSEEDCHGKKNEAPLPPSGRGAAVHGSTTHQKRAVVLIHDGVRPFWDHDLIDRVVDGVRAHGAAIPVVPVVDTLKRGDGRGFVSEIGGSVDRSRLYHVQTPQGFDLDLIMTAHRHAVRTGFQGTDDASLIEHLKGAKHLQGCSDDIQHRVDGISNHGLPDGPFKLRVAMVQGARYNIKITTQEDMALAGFLLSRDGEKH